VKHALLRIGAVAMASSVSAVVLFGVGRVILIGDLGIALPSTSQTDAPTPSPSPTPTPAVLSETATPEPSPTETAAPTPAPLELTAFRFEGRSYLGIVVPDISRTFTAPFAGTIEIRTYQFINGQVRVGSNVASLPFYPYISVVAPDRRITYRPGTIAATELLVPDGATVGVGDPLFRLIGPGRSSWTTFYDSSAPYDVVVSLQSVPGGRDLDPSIYFN
jgi:hypothetical protein